MSRDSGKSPQGGRRYGNRTAEERRAERRDRLVQCAVRTFAAQGYANTSIEQLCSAANLSTRNFYEAFPNKEALLGEIHDRRNAEAFEAVITALADIEPEDIAARATSGLRAYFTTMAKDPDWARIVLVECVGVSRDLEARRQAATERFAQMLEAEADRIAGHAPSQTEAPGFRLTSIAAVGAIKELVTYWATSGTDPELLDDVVAEAVRTLVALLVA